MTEEEKQLIEKHSVKRLRALKDIDPRLGRPLGKKILKALRRGTMVDSGNKLIRGPHWNKIARDIPPTFSPNYQMGENRATVVETTEVRRPWAVGGVNAEAYDVERIEGQEFEIADESPYFRARELVLTRQAELLPGEAAVCHELIENGVLRYHPYWQVGYWSDRNKYGTIQGGTWELVEWFGVAGLKGFPTQATRLYLQPVNFSPDVCCLRASRPNSVIAWAA